MSDITYALRGFLRTPAFTIAAVLSLALGIGANVTIYTIANSFLNKPIPGVADPDRLVRVYRGSHSPLSYRDLAQVRAQNTVFSGVTGERMLPVAVANGEANERALASLVSPGYFDVLGVRPSVGRLFGLADSAESNVAVVSDAFWERRFGRDRSPVGEEIRVNGHTYRIIGVAPREFISSIALWRAEMWLPPAASRLLTGSTLEDWGGSLYVTARLEPGMERAQADAALRTIAARIIAADSAGRRNFSLHADHARGMTAELRQTAMVASTFLMVVVGLVLLIACANVANLLLARAAARRREIGVRIAMGARRGRLVRQLLAESALLALVAGAVGVVAAAWIADLVAQYVTSRSPEPVLLSFTPDGRVLVFTLFVSALTTLVFGLIPALRATSFDILPVLREEAPQSSGRSRLRSGLIAAQVALCTVLLACSTLFLRSLANARDIEPGFDARGIVDLPLDISSRNMSAEQSAAFYGRLLERVRSLAGVRSATIAAIVPLGGSNMQIRTIVEGRPSSDDAPGGSYMPYFNVVEADYFRTLGIDVLRGRAFGPQDVRDGPGVVIVNEQMARRVWPNDNPIGKRVSFDSATGPWRTVVGVVRNTKYNSLGEDPPEFMYLPLSQSRRSEAILHVRAANGAGTGPLHRALPAIVNELDPMLPMMSPALMVDDMRIALLPAQLGASLLGAFGTLALLLASVGIYGVASYGVAQRTRELGIRSALGATARDVMRMILTQSLRTVSIGAAIGLVLALAVARLIASQLYGVRPTDPVTFIGMPIFLIGIAVLATLIPARRATRVDPIEALRVE
jgi:predicted permease